MKNIVTTLVISVLFLGVFGQTPFPKKTVSPGFFPAGIQSIDKAQVDALKNRRLQANSGSRAVQQIVVDYDAADEIVTTDEGGTYDRLIWDLNSNFTDDDTNRFALTWAVTRFDTLYDADGQVRYPLSSTPVTLDSLWVFFTHQNTTGTPDTIEVSVYKWQGALGIQVNAQEEIINQEWYDTLIITTTSLTAAANQLGQMLITPNLSLPANTKFSVGVHFYGDTTNSTFTILAGSGDRCGGACFAYPSVFDLNSLWRMIAWSGQNNLTGINGIAFNCNGNGVVGEPEECEEFPIQNYAITAFLTIDPALTASVSPAETICPGETVALSVSPVGGTPPYNVSWNPTTGLTNPFSPTTNASVNATTTYTATIIDGTPDTIYKSVTITVNAISVDAGADQNVGCGQTATLTATPGGVVTGATFSWSNGVNTLNNPNVGAGTYTITATNSFGCSATDNVTVAIPGVNQALSFNINVANNIGCRNAAISFTNTSTNKTGWSWAWDFGDNSGNISTAQDPSYTYSATGTYTITLNADSSGCSVSAYSKNLTIQNCVGIEETSLSNHIEMYPNPTTGVVTLAFNDLKGSTGTIGVYDVAGKLVVEEPVSVSGSIQKTLNLSTVADGVYFVKIQLGNDVLMRKLNVTR